MEPVLANMNLIGLEQLKNFSSQIFGSKLKKLTSKESLQHIYNSNQILKKNPSSRNHMLGNFVTSDGSLKLKSGSLLKSPGKKFKTNKMMKNVHNDSLSNFIYINN